jgi:hypothetical protein
MRWGRATLAQASPSRDFAREIPGFGCETESFRAKCARNRAGRFSPFAAAATSAAKNSIKVKAMAQTSS